MSNTLKVLKECREQIISETYPANTSDVSPITDPNFPGYSIGVKDCLSVIDKKIKMLEVKDSLSKSTGAKPSFIDISDEYPIVDEMVVIYYSDDYIIAFYESDDIFDSPDIGFVRAKYWCPLPEEPK